ncbi:hypothetical protein M622_18560 [Thauera terpenica 58Eu]|uniref:Transmembrane protein n=1 Tax=Thauera terpenica 58Eu TaxID=1348657 RepID=T0ANE2_9RHOO|nr:hypothetical protein [Thauera terpenica]EPZ14394.1 hypothetical protein M622_18560 [Thauera terpenica 58Eu]
MTRQQARVYIACGLALMGLGFAISGPSVPNFWLWMTLPGIMIAGGIIRLLFRS